MKHRATIAWRNLWRNPRRTVITLAAVALGTAVLILVQGLTDGLLTGAVRNATGLGVGEVQIHAPDYLADRSIYETLPEPERILSAAHSQGVAGAARSYGYGLAALGAKSAGASFWGIDPGAERMAFDLARHVADGGRFLAPAAERGLVLGRKLAHTLGAHVGSQVVVVVQAADGSLGNDLFTVTGVLEATSDVIDRSAAILHRDDFAELFASEDLVHEIALNTRGKVPLDRVEAIARLTAPGQDVRTWRELVPALSDMLEMAGASLWIFGMVFFLTAGLGILNTMLMATHERTHEFGVLKAIGTPPSRLLLDVGTEAAAIGLLGSIAGVVTGTALVWLLEVHGIDTRRFAGQTSISGIAFDPVWRAELGAGTLFRPMLGMWATSVIAALYPAAVAARLEPTTAIRRV